MQRNYHQNGYGLLRLWRTRPRSQACQVFFSAIPDGGPGATREASHRDELDCAQESERPERFLTCWEGACRNTHGLKAVPSIKH